MRAYLVKAGNKKRYAGTQAESKATRDDLMEETGAKKKDVAIDEVEIPMEKAKLLEFINELLAGSEA